MVEAIPEEKGNIVEWHQFSYENKTTGNKMAAGSKPMRVLGSYFHMVTKSVTKHRKRV